MANNQNNLWMGAALAGLLGTLTTILTPKRDRRNWAHQAKHMADQMMSGRASLAKKETNHHVLIGSVAGSIVGITTALLLAPKAGTDLLKDLSKSFQSSETGSRSRSSRTSHSTGAKRAHPASKIKSAANRVASKAKSGASKAMSGATTAKKKAAAPIKKRAAPKKKHAAPSAAKVAEAQSE